MSKHIIILLTVLACACCASAPPKKHIFYAEPLEPEGWFEEVFASVKQCARSLGKASDVSYEDIEWYIMEQESIPGVAGLFSKPNRIYLDEAFAVNEWVIRHESAHAALIAGHNAHEDAAFQQCAEVPNAGH